MNHEHYKLLIASKAFEMLPNETREFLQKIMSVPTEARDTEVKESVLEVEMETEVVAPKVVEVLAEVPKSSRTLRLKPTLTKETTKDKKGIWLAIPVRASPRRNPPKPTTQEKGKAINLEPKGENIEDVPMDNEDVGVEVEEIEAQSADPITRFPEYVPPRKPKTKVPKHINDRKTPLQTPLLQDEIFFDGPCLVRVALLKLVDCDLADHEKFSHLATEHLMHHIIDTNTGMTALEPRRWLKGVDKAGLLNLLWVPHYNGTPVIVVVIKKLLCLVHDGCMWLEELIPITDRLIHWITRFPYTGENSAMIFCGKGDEQALTKSMKQKFKLVKKPR